MGKQKRSSSEQLVSADDTEKIPDVSRRRLTEGDVMRDAAKRGSVSVNHGTSRNGRLSIGTILKELEKTKPKPRLMNIALKLDMRRKVSVSA